MSDHLIQPLLDLIDVNPSAAMAIGFINPLGAQLDLALTGKLGLGKLHADLTGELNAALNVGISFAGPTLALTGIAQLQAQLALPSVSVGANAALIADLELQIGGLEAMIAAAFAVKLPAINFAGQLAANLKLGPVTVLAWKDATQSEVSGWVNEALNGLSSSGPPPNSYGVMIVTASPAAWGGINFMLNTGLA
jgi:hypothetical protein